ncbi:hypothetical protein Misp02_25520 [Microtetraspora sp. NBRC 16547]|nr:hypothetical protein Misp02_25520 [Microtetraspora sp. NBRC 16547]
MAAMEDRRPEPQATSSGRSLSNPAGTPSVTSSVSVGLALLVVLESLTPAERLAFVRRVS